VIVVGVEKRVLAAFVLNEKPVDSHCGGLSRNEFS
jgi:hypothetical protein